MKEPMSSGDRATYRLAVSRNILLCILVLSVVVSSTVSAQDHSLSLVHESNPSRKLRITGLVHNGLTYASVNDIAQALSIRSVVNREEQSLSVATTPPVVFFDDNPFVATMNQAGRKTAIQLAAGVRVVQNEFFIPIASSAPFFAQLFGTPARFDVSSGSIRLEKPLRPPSPFDIASLAIDVKANGIIIRVSSTKPLPVFEGLLNKEGWYYLTVPNARADIAALNRTKPAGAIKKIVAQQFQTSAQIAFQLEGEFSSSKVEKDGLSNDLLITLRSLSEETLTALEERKRQSANNELERFRKKYELDVIVLDAGHGGRDPGAIGVTGTKEKDVTLGIVLKLEKLIKRNLKGVRVELTRDDDTFVELDKRGRIANERGGKLFISVHANSMPRKPHANRGFEVYLLRPGRTDEAIAIAERENSVIKLEEGYEERYKHLTDDNFILVTMAQSAHMRASERFAELATQEMNKHLDIPNHGVKQAGFLVLVGSAMPNVLVETAYLSNREDEKLLRSESGQEKIANALFNAIKRYKVEYEKLLMEGKELGVK